VDDEDASRTLAFESLSWGGWGVCTGSKVEPRIVTETGLEGKVTVVEVAARYVTAIRLPEVVNAVVVGDSSAFQVEHSEHEPRLVFVKALSTKASETNLLISTAGGHEVSLLLISRERAILQIGLMLISC